MLSSTSSGVISAVLALVAVVASLLGSLAEAAPGKHFLNVQGATNGYKYGRIMDLNSGE